MNRKYYILVFLFIFTGYILAQSENDKIIKADTVIFEKIDSVEIEKNINEHEKKKDFYNDYMPSLHKTDSNKLNTKTNKAKFGIFGRPADDSLSLNNEKALIFSAKMGPGKGSALFSSIGLSVPVYSNINITCKYLTGDKLDFGGSPHYPVSFLGIGAGLVQKNENVFYKLNMYICKNTLSDQLLKYSGLFHNKNDLGLNIEADVLLKLFKPVYISFGPEFVVTTHDVAWAFSLGMNIAFTKKIMPAQNDISNSDPFIPKRERISMFLVETGVGISTKVNRQIVSFAFRAPISDYFHILLKHCNEFERYGYCSVLLGYSFFINRSIIDISWGPCIPLGLTRKHKVSEALYSTTDVSYYYRISRKIAVSATLGSFFIIKPSTIAVGAGYSFW